MKFRIGKAGPLVASGIAIYVLTLIAQSRAAESLCERYSVGSQIDDIESLEGTFFLSPMGPLPDPGNPSAQSIVFCANMTMCDTSCRLEIEDRIVTSATYSAH